VGECGQVESDVGAEPLKDLVHAALVGDVTFAVDAVDLVPVLAQVTQEMFPDESV